MRQVKATFQLMLLCGEICTAVVLVNIITCGLDCNSFLSNTLDYPSGGGGPSLVLDGCFSFFLVLHIVSQALIQVWVQACFLIIAST